MLKDALLNIVNVKTVLIIHAQILCQNFSVQQYYIMIIVVNALNKAINIHLTLAL